MASKIYQQVPKERYDLIMSRYKEYLSALNDPEKDPVRVFDPLPQKLIDELEMIREVSRELQAKKEEDMRKAAQAASQAEEEAKKAAEAEKENKEEEKEEKIESESK